MRLRDNTTDLVTVLKHSLEAEVKETITKEIIEKYTEMMRGELTHLIEERLERVSFDHIESFRDAMSLNQELNVHIRVGKENT